MKLVGYLDPGCEAVGVKSQLWKSVSTCKLVLSDLFRSHDLGGFAKVLWILFIIIVPYLGVFVYLIARGHKMAEHAQSAAQAQDAAAKQYIQQAAGTTRSPAEEIAHLNDLKTQGVLTDAEFETAKAKALAS